MSILKGKTKKNRILIEKNRKTEKTAKSGHILHAFFGCIETTLNQKNLKGRAE